MDVSFSFNFQVVQLSDWLTKLEYNECYGTEYGTFAEHTPHRFDQPNH